MHSGRKAGLRPRLHETNANTSPTKIRLATPRWKKLAIVCKLRENRVDYMNQSIDFTNLVCQNTEKYFCSGANRGLGHSQEEDGRPKLCPLKADLSARAIRAISLIGSSSG